MASLRFMLPIFAVLVLGLCWSVNANQTQGTLPPGFATNYVTPMANLSVEKLIGRWYMTEYVTYKSDRDEFLSFCLLLDFHYNDNGTLMVAPMPLEDKDRPSFTLPVSENGVWDVIRYGVLLTSHVVVHVDNRFLAVGVCKKGIVKNCGAYLMVRRVADADCRGELEELRSRLVDAGVDAAEGGFVSAIEPCRPATTTAADLSVETGPSTPDTE